MFGLVVRFDLKDADAARGFDRLVELTLPKIGTHEPGTLLYAVHEVADAPLSRIFYEMYQDREAFDAHEAQPHVVHFLAERGRYIDRFRVEFLNRTGGTAPGHG